MQPKGSQQQELSLEKNSKSQESVLDEEVVSTSLSKTAAEKERKKKMKAEILIEHVDIIKDEFWEARPWILSGRFG
jgi:hypothetical protein